MGWCGINTDKSFNEVFRNEFVSYLNNEMIRRYIECHVDPPYDHDTCDESEFFLAVFRTSYIGCDIIIFKRSLDKSTVLYKMMSDIEGPYTINKCPKEILDLLSPIEHYNQPGYAKKWRDDQY